MLKRIFISGLTLTLALTITGYVIVGLFRFCDGFLGKPINAFVYKYFGQTIPGLGIVIGILIIFIMGTLIQLSRMRFFRWFYRRLAGAFSRIPLVSKIYFPVKQIIDFFFFPPKKNFKSAVLVEYPRKGVYSLGFITNENNIEFSDRARGKHYNVCPSLCLKTQCCFRW